MTGPRRQRVVRPGARGLTLVEAAVSLVVVSIMLLAALGTVGVNTGLETRVVQSETGVRLAEDLLAEILDASCDDPDQPPRWGLEPGERPGVRADFDDVDDYDGWRRSPPQHADGTIIGAAARYERRVQVAHIDPHDLAAVPVGATGAKRIRVQVRCGDRTVATLEGFRVAAWGDPRGSNGEAP